jgi:hypothetical protein
MGETERSLSLSAALLIELKFKKAVRSDGGRQTN